MRKKKKLTLSSLNERKDVIPQHRKQFVYEYCYVCKKCGHVIKTINSRTFKSENTTCDFCPQCDKMVEVAIKQGLVTMTELNYSNGKNE